VTALERVDLPDDVEAVGAYLLQRGLSDGLPVVPPTEERVADLVRGLGPEADPAAVVGAIPPLGAVLTLEKLAVCAVMAGCQRRHVPVLEAAVRAVLEPAFVLQSVQTTTSAAGPFLVVNGPARHAAGINGGAGCFGPGPASAANAVIGRALRLVLLAVGGAVPGDVDPAPLGWPGKFTCCIAEHEEASPWEPLHVERGYRRDASTVTAIPASGMWQIAEPSAEPTAVLHQVTHGMVSTGHQAAPQAPEPFQPVLVLSPTIAGLVARGLVELGRPPTKQALKEHLWEHARVPLAWLPRYRHDATRRRMAELGLAFGPGETVPRCERSEDWIVLVAGGPAGVQSAGLSTTVLSRSVTVEVAGP
jgi:hypothetical protein